MAVTNLGSQLNRQWRADLNENFEYLDQKLNDTYSNLVEVKYASTNKYDYSAQTDNVVKKDFVINLGNEVAVAGYYASGPIPLEANKTYTLKAPWGAAATSSRGSMYNAAGQYLGVFSTETFTTVANTAYIRITCTAHPKTLTDLMIVEGNTYPTQYAPYGIVLPPSYSVDFTNARNKPTKSVYVTRTGDVMRVTSKYNDSKDLRIRMQKKGPNALFDFNQFDLIDNTDSGVSNTQTGGTSFLANGTDFIAPYIVRAVANIDGDNQTSNFFTGGNHGYDNTGTTTNNAATAQNVSITLFVDGKKISGDVQTYADTIEIVWINRIQAYNTTKSAGGGREVLEERVSAFFDGRIWKMRSEVKALENVIMNRWYGYQIATYTTYDFIRYVGGTNRKEQALKVAHDSGSKKCNLLQFRKGTDYAEMRLYSVDVGDCALSTQSYSAFSTNLGKTYFAPIYGDVSLSTGDTLVIEGSYRFFGGV